MGLWRRPKGMASISAATKGGSELLRRQAMTGTAERETGRCSGLGALATLQLRATYMAVRVGVPVSLSKSSSSSGSTSGNCNSSSRSSTLQYVGVAVAVAIAVRRSSSSSGSASGICSRGFAGASNSCTHACSVLCCAHARSVWFTHESHARMRAARREDVGGRMWDYMDVCADNDVSAAA